jgi:hypothetical protein
MTITEAGRGAMSRGNFWLGVAAYIVPTFPIAYVWHLVLFLPAYAGPRDLPSRSHHSLQLSFP